MLTADLVVARRYKGELRLRALRPDEEAAARELALALVREAHAHVGQSRERLVAAWEALPGGALDRRVVLALRKLVLDACAFSSASAHDPVELRRALFSAAASARAALADGTILDRDSVVASVASGLGLSPSALEDGLFSDLRDADTLTSGPALSGETLADGFAAAQAQAALLRATRAVCTVATRDAAEVRAFFRTLKFHKLLFEVEATGEGAFSLTIDGPFSLFESVTRYGLGFAMLVPALERLTAYELEADLLWGKERTPLRLRLQGGTGAPTRASTPGDAAGVSDDVSKLLAGLAPLAEACGARCALSAELVHLPGAGLVVPDLVVQRGDRRVFVELLGFWSRDAVWRRVEIVERGLGERVVFCASARLRVREGVLDDDRASLYVFKGVPSARKVMDRVTRLLDAPP